MPAGIRAMGTSRSTARAIATSGSVTRITAMPPGVSRGSASSTAPADDESNAARYLGDAMKIRSHGEACAGVLTPVIRRWPWHSAAPPSSRASA